MKKLLLLVCLSVVFCAAAAQDIITTHQAEEIEAKVTKIGLREIEYLKWERQDGPVYVIAKRDVFFIKFADGTKEIITPSGAQRAPQDASGYGWSESTPATAGPQEPIGIKPWGMRHPRQPRVAAHDIYPRYQGEVAFGYGLGVGALSDYRNTDRIVFETVHGVRICPYAFAGIGLGYNLFYGLKGKEMYSEEEGGYRQYTSGGAMPLFANTKGYFPLSKKLSVYLSLDLGVGIPVSGSLKEGNTQFYTAVGPGVTFGKKLRGDFGIRFQHMGEGANAILFRVGFGF